jgi:hypothetical protein
MKGWVNKILQQGDIIVIATVSVLLLFYTAYRAATLSFTYDESLSFNMYSASDFMDIVSYSPPSSNNHMLNSLLIHYISLIFGNDDFLFRVPSVLSHLAYLVFTYRISKMSGNRLVTLFGFLLFNMNPFMLDFFSLARGYAMSLAFTSAGLYFMMRYIRSGKNWYLAILLSCLFMGVLSNFTLIILFAGVVLTLNVYWIAVIGKMNIADLLKKNIPVICYTVPLAVILFEPLRKLLKYKEFYDGGNIGFWSDTVGSLINASQYNSGNHITGIIFRVMIILCFLLLIAGSIRLLKLKPFQFNDPLYLGLVLLLATISIPVIQHYFTGSLYPINRMALFLVPVFIVPLIFLSADFFPGTLLKNLPVIITGLLSAFLTFNTIRNINLTHTLLWKYDSGTEKMLEDLSCKILSSGKSEITLGINPLFEPTVNYYRFVKKYDWLEKVSDDGYAKRTYDYYYITAEDFKATGNINLEEISHYPEADNSVLFKKLY